MAAARTRFVRDGYAATTLERIAEDAGVAVQTVYFHFGNKRSVLKEVVDVASTGDDEPAALLERPWVEDVRAAPDGNASLAAWIRGSREVFGRVAPILRIVRDAASSDPDMAAQWAANQEQRLTAHRSLARILADKDALRAGLTVEEAADVLFTLISLEVYVLLTGERGWSADRWEHWVTRTVADAVLRRS